MEQHRTTMQIRRYIRLPVECTVEFSGEESYGEGTLVDLSTGGCTISSNQPIQVGRLLRLRLHLPDNGEPAVIQQAKVKWVRASQFGVEILSISKDNQQRLNEYIVNSVNKPSLRNRRSPRSSNISG